jgi:hypothetical protein
MFNEVGLLHQTYSFSGDSTYNRSTFRPQSSIQSYYTTLNHLTDVLSKREHLLRQYLELSKNVLKLPYSLTASPGNPLIDEVKKGFLFIDPTNYLNEFSRNTLYSSLTYFKFLYFKNILTTITSSLTLAPFNSQFLTDNFFFYFLGSNPNKIGANDELYKNQFRPLRKGVSSLLRLHATAAIALPVEIRLQILASSRDVIHS